MNSTQPFQKVTNKLPSRRGRSKATVDLEIAIVDIVSERHPITVRGVCYALFTRELISSMSVGNTQKVSKIMTRMRESGNLDWRLVVDGSRATNRASTWMNPNQIIQAAVNNYRRNYWQDQPMLVEVWSEKSTVEGVLQPVLDEYGVTFRVMKGFSSFTALRQAAEDSHALPEDRTGIVLYLGDYDPSGLWMSERDIPDRLERYGSQWEFQRIAVLESDTPNLPGFNADTKTGDARHRWYEQKFGKRCWELDAIDPNVLRTRVSEQISTRLNLLAWDHAKSIELAEIDSMREFHNAWLNCGGEA